MTVSASTARADYTGNGTTTAFSVPFYFLDNTHLIVYKTVSGVTSTLVLNSDYTVTGAASPSGGTVTCTVAPAAGATLAILRNVPLSQAMHYVPNDPFPAASHEQALDKLTMIVQQQAESVSRSVTLPAAASGISAALPTPQAGAVLGWNTLGNALTNLTPQTSTYAVPQTTVTGAAVMPKGTTGERDSSPQAGYFRFNTTLGQFEGWNGTAWGAVGGGATGGSGSAAFYENDQTITADYTLTTGKNAMSAGPITIADGKTVTVPTGATWTVV